MANPAVSRLSSPEVFLKDWATLYQNADKATFFQSPAWMAAWLGGIPDGAALYRIEVSDDDGAKLLGVVGRKGRRAPPLFGFTEARFHEFGDADYDAIYVEYNDFLTAINADELRVAALHALLDEMDKTDSVVFRNITPAMTQAVKTVAETRSLNCRVLSQQPVYASDLATTRANRAAFIESLSAGLRADIRRSLRIYEARGAVHCRLAQSQEKKAQAWKTLVELHSARWRARGKPGAFANSKFIAFHDRLRSAAPQACHLVEVTVGDQTLGVLYNFVHGERVLHYQSGFSYEGDKRMTPGLVCHALACQMYMENGYGLYDFMAGESEYKRRFGEEETVLTSVALDRRGLRRTVYDFAKGLSRNAINAGRELRYRFLSGRAGPRAKARLPKSRPPSRSVAKTGSHFSLGALARRP